MLSSKTVKATDVKFDVRVPRDNFSFKGTLWPGSRELDLFYFLSQFVVTKSIYTHSLAPSS